MPRQHDCIVSILLCSIVIGQFPFCKHDEDLKRRSLSQLLTGFDRATLLSSARAFLLAGQPHRPSLAFAVRLLSLYNFPLSGLICYHCGRALHSSSFLLPLPKSAYYHPRLAEQWQNPPPPPEQRLLTKATIQKGSPTQNNQYQQDTYFPSKFVEKFTVFFSFIAPLLFAFSEQSYPHLLPQFTCKARGGLRY